MPIPSFYRQGSFDYHDSGQRTAQERFLNRCPPVLRHAQDERTRLGRGWSGMVYAPVWGCLAGYPWLPGRGVEGLNSFGIAGNRPIQTGKIKKTYHFQSFPIISALWEAFPGSRFSAFVGVSVHFPQAAEHGTTAKGARRSGVLRSLSSTVSTRSSVYPKGGSGQGPKCHWAKVFWFSIPHEAEGTFRRTKRPCLLMGFARSGEQTAGVSHLCGQHRLSNREVTLTGKWALQPRHSRCLSPPRGRQRSRRVCLPRPLSRRAAP